MTKAKQENERQTLLAQLQQMDRHGVWTDEKSKNEGYPPLTLREARARWSFMSDPKNQ